MSSELFINIAALREAWHREQERREQAYKQEILRRLEQCLNDQDALAPGSSLHELTQKSAQIRQAIIRQLAENGLEYTAPDFSNKTIQAAPEKSGPAVAAHSVADLLGLLRRLAVLDQAEALRLSKLLEAENGGAPAKLEQTGRPEDPGQAGKPGKPENQGRIDALAVQFKISLGRAAEIFAKDLCYRRELGAMLAAIGENAANKEQAPALNKTLAQALAQALSSPAPIGQATFESLSKQFAAVKKNAAAALLAESAIDLFKQQGYALYDEQGNPVDDASSRCYVGLGAAAEYHAMLKTRPDGSLSLRFVRFVENEKELAARGEYQQQKDREAAAKWCSDCVDLEKHLQDLGIAAQTIIKRDEKADLLVMVNKDLAPAVARQRETARSSRELAAK